MVWAFFVPSRSWEARATDIFGGALETRQEQTSQGRRGLPDPGDKVAKGYGGWAAGRQSFARAALTARQPAPAAARQLAAKRLGRKQLKRNQLKRKRLQRKPLEVLMGRSAIARLESWA
jgi:hypothetical protein